MPWYASNTIVEQSSDIGTGEEHKPDINLEAAPSYCTLPLFHPHADLADAPPSGHVSYDGHAYLCKNPALLQKSYHM